MATVSRVLRDKPGVSESTRQAVLAALDVLGYARPTSPVEANPVVGIVAPGFTVYWHDPWFQLRQELVRALQNAVCLPVVVHVPHDSDYRSTTHAGRNSSSPTSPLDQLLLRGVNGIVWIGDTGATETLTELVAADIPRLVVGTAAEPGVSRMAVDLGAAIDLAVKHLAQLGHRQLGLSIAADPLSSAAVQAFRRSVAGRLHIAGTRAQAPVVTSPHGMEAGAQAASTLLRAGCSALITGAPSLTMGALQAARSLGVSVPDQLSILGVGDVDGGTMTDPALTMITPPWRFMAEAAVTDILGQIERQTTGPGVVLPEAAELSYQAELVLRASTAPPPRR
ncbi:LacI family DNA-binding transcriptional regulator [Saxibacter everestensis]|uniref:LacI family DNA-binding transcriptional regulator n=1 Tax=Saxibacter everestensis TaxID=2909229 RepID=A0ABY8QW16_9MICO|nr:LacI family DNA-binding transcriptional regulator [Brevibacteriaceae bacterium ZFBP1038]